MEFFNEHREIEKTHHKLPHWQQGRVPVFVTFRLSDSLPQSVVGSLLSERDTFLAMNPKPWDEATEDFYHRQFSMKLEEYLDAGHGCCALCDPRVANVVVERLRHFDVQRYNVHSYVIMPNHVHALFTPHGSGSLPEIIKAWKGVSSRMIHKAGMSGRLARE